VSFVVTGLCEVETGQSNIILDIEESRGTRKIFFKHYLHHSVILRFVDRASLYMRVKKPN
jgi:hypothetical protein